jgi:hypothetical protein
MVGPWNTLLNQDTFYKMLEDSTIPMSIGFSHKQAIQTYITNINTNDKVMEKTFIVYFA